jgi:hypothetical protein
MITNKNATILFSLFFATSVMAQNLTKPSDYADAVSNSQKEISNEIIGRLTKLVRGDVMKTETASRKVLVQKAKAASLAAIKLPAFNNDHSLADSLSAYCKRMSLLVDNELAKAEKLQDSAQKTTHEAAQRFVLAKEKVFGLLLKEESNFNTQLKAFANANKTKLGSKQLAEYERLVYLQSVDKHHNTVYLVYSKCSKQEALLAKAIKMRWKEDLEKHAKLLEKHIAEGNKTLDTIKLFKNYKDQIMATRELLAFYKKECEYRVPVLVSFLMRGGEDKSLSKVDIGNNIKVNPNVNIEDKNKVATYATTEQSIDAERPAVLGKWAETSREFFEKFL